ncbi:hypothetical protein CsatA_001681 [Cannabis sativa]
MGRTPCCDQKGLRKGAWTAEEDQILFSYIKQHGEGGWRHLPQKAGLSRCGKSCRLRWANYLRPGIKRGEFSPEEEQTIIRLHAILGNRWSIISRHLYRRTDNEVKNYWNTRLKKRGTTEINSKDSPVRHKTNDDDSSDNGNIIINSTAISEENIINNYSNSDNVTKEASTSSPSSSSSTTDYVLNRGLQNLMSPISITTTTTTNSKGLATISTSLDTEISSNSLQMNKGISTDTASSSVSTSIKACGDDHLNVSRTTSSTASASSRALLNKIASKLNQINLGTIIGMGSGGSGGARDGVEHRTMDYSSPNFCCTPSIDDNINSITSYNVEDLLEEAECQQSMEMLHFDDHISSNATLEAEDNSLVDDTNTSNFNYFDDAKDGGKSANISLDEQLLLPNHFSMDCLEDVLRYM